MSYIIRIYTDAGLVGTGEARSHPMIYGVSVQSIEAWQLKTNKKRRKIV